MQQLKYLLILACLAFAAIMLGPLDRVEAAGAVVGGSYQDNGGIFCQSANSCRLNLSPMKADTRLTSISCNLIIGSGFDPSILTELVLGQTRNRGGLVYLAPIQLGSSQSGGPYSYQVYVSQPNYGVAAGNRPYVEALLAKPVDMNLNCGITGQ